MLREEAFGVSLTPTLTAQVARPALAVSVQFGKHQGMTRDASATERRPLEALLRALSERAPDTTAWGRAFEYAADPALWSSPEFGARIKQYGASADEQQRRRVLIGAPAFVNHFEHWSVPRDQDRRDGMVSDGMRASCRFTRIVTSTKDATGRSPSAWMTTGWSRNRRDPRLADDRLKNTCIRRGRRS